MVRKVKRDSYMARNFPEIQVGDVLLEIDGIRFGGDQFEDAMKELRRKLSSRTVCEIVFRTAEEKLRRIRRGQNPSAKRSEGLRVDEGGARVGEAGEDEAMWAMSTTQRMFSNRETSSERESQETELPIRVDLRQADANLLIVVEMADEKAIAEYRINNMSPSHLMYYKQKNIPGNKWYVLQPGESTHYIWENPFATHKLLLVRAGHNILSLDPPREVKGSIISSLCDKGKLITAPLHYLAGSQGESDVIACKFDEIGFSDKLPLPHCSTELHVEVFSEGPAKMLNIFPATNFPSELSFAKQFAIAQIDELKKGIYELSEEMQRHLEIDLDPTLNECIARDGTRLTEKIDRSKEDLIDRIDERQNFLCGKLSLGDASLDLGVSRSERRASLGFDATTLGAYKSPFVSVLGDLEIPHTQSLLMEVLEARDLVPYVTGKKESVYCEIYVKKHKLGDLDYLRRTDDAKPHCTYVCDETLDPTWRGQRFLIPIPEGSVPGRKSLVRVKVMCKSVVDVLNRSLGHVDIEVCVKMLTVVSSKELLLFTLMFLTVLRH